jgi:hypothetical protein
MSIRELFGVLRNMSDLKAHEEAAEQAANPEKLRDGPSGSGRTFAYTVEARLMFHKPEQFGDIILDKDWRQIHFKEGSTGIPPGNRYELPELLHAGAYSYEAAQALRWWFMADVHAKSPTGTLCLETRLVEYRIEFSYKAVPERVVEYVERASPAERAD